MKKIKIISCLVTLGIMILIFYFSSQDAVNSSEMSEGVTNRLIDFILSPSRLSAGEKHEIAEGIHGFIRKVAHFTIYAALGMSTFVSAKLHIQKKKTVIFAIAVGFCMLYAISDEIHQISSAGRSCEIRDVLIDTAGAVTGILFMLAVITVAKYIVNRRKGVV